MQPFEVEKKQAFQLAFLLIQLKYFLRYCYPLSLLLFLPPDLSVLSLVGRFTGFLSTGLTEGLSTCGLDGFTAGLDDLS